MSQKTIYLIIGLIVTAVLGVILLQLDMIRTGMEVNEQRYDEAVQDALKNAARELEQQEASEINLQTNGFNSSESNINLGPGKFTRDIQRSKLLGNNGILIPEPYSYRLRLENQYNNKDLVERVDRSSLEKKLQNEIENANLEGALEYGVYDNRKKEFIIRNGRRLSEIGADTSRHLDLLHSNFRVSLFAGEVDTPGYLMAYSPQKKTVIFNSIWYNLVASLLFVGIILGCFIYTIYVILFQKKLSEMKTDFINNMTHEFKTPIATISLATDSIVSPRVSGDPEKVKRFANIIKQENKRMNDQVEKVLQMAKLDKSKLNLNLTAVDLNDVVTDAAVYISLQVEPRGGSVETKLQAEPAIVEGDMTHLSSLVNNLLDNANKYSPDAPKIIVSTRNVSKGVEVTVTDHGLGMTREARKNIFDRFYRVHTGDRHDVKGFGLGLSYVKTITEAHNGTINVKSELGKGSSFIVTFPYRQD
ncbi:sensor histidine kinase [Neolewinella agarilytica]|uniref:histidine kinase n=1 Tax=Neolewinella agarilytica TaxID=478744 RepID=A0A1H9BGP5_9BACT|nr:HAMP domain-containing sensor histidine kinase [Neolewinella agarilytica]SEP87458.1 two-component system, OmpR family, phosphate regulon sensor histidine kinase PhoR [Neolewinella agarilytica]